MVILKSTAVPGLSLNLGVEVKKGLFIYFERHARRVLLESSGMPRIFHSQRPKNNDEGLTKLGYSILFYFIL